MYPRTNPYSLLFSTPLRRRPTFTLIPLFLLRLTLLLVGPLLDPLEHVFSMMHEHPAKARSRRLDQVAVAFGWFAAGFDVVPDAVRV